MAGKRKINNKIPGKGRKKQKKEKSKKVQGKEDNDVTLSLW